MNKIYLYIDIHYKNTLYDKLIINNLIINLLNYLILSKSIII